MSNTLKISILTPTREFFKGDIIKLVSENSIGRFGILPNHIPYTTVIKPTITEFVTADGKTLKAFTSTGILEVNNNEIKILSNSCEWPEEIDLQRAEKAKERALKRLTQKDGVDVKRAELALLRSLTRIKIKSLSDDYPL